MSWALAMPPIAKAVQAGHQQGAVGRALDHAAAQGQGVGQVGLLHRPDVDAGGGVSVD